MSLIDAAERGWFPDWLVRLGIRRLLRQRLRGFGSSSPERRTAAEHEFLAELRDSPIAVSTDCANTQHYEVPAAFFQRVLGAHLKYSCCFYPPGVKRLEEAEEAMLGLTCRRAQIEDGMEILELGCGWGSLTLWMGEKFPRSRILAVSNSLGQRRFIEGQCAERGLRNIEIVTADMCHFDTPRVFDRVVSIEMFEHMRNYELLLRNISRWLRSDGKLFVHVFCHRASNYFFRVTGESDWMAQHFFTGGLMPAEHLLLRFQDNLSIEQHWRLNGSHYWRTCEEWLRRQDASREAILSIFREQLSSKEAQRLYQRWRIFFMACAELFRYRGGAEWFVSHYLFQNRASSAPARAIPGREATAQTN